MRAGWSRLGRVGEVLSSGGYSLLQRREPKRRTYTAAEVRSMAETCDLEGWHAIKRAERLERALQLIHAHSWDADLVRSTSRAALYDDHGDTPERDIGADYSRIQTRGEQ